MPRAVETASFRFNHTMIRVKDPKASLAFYQETLGMDLISVRKFDDFSVYFLAFNHNGKELTPEEKEASTFSRVLELTHNHGTESDPNFQGYNSSDNSNPGRGFGHITITVDNLKEACERFERLGVQLKKRPSDGEMKHIAFFDPDGYWIDVVATYKHP